MMPRSWKVRLVAFIIRWSHGPVSVDLTAVREWAGDDIWHEAIGDA